MAVAALAVGGVLPGTTGRARREFPDRLRALGAVVSFVGAALAVGTALV
jgi:hypothetical protein